ncbi:hypothetical protein DFS34DRAFT_684971 [Phlyctochytrium arcticum]|nr:hypothetical protein DFS34DRAFT_684971 [Phlyctochytrium arcticum]
MSSAAYNPDNALAEADERVDELPSNTQFSTKSRIPPPSRLTSKQNSRRRRSSVRKFDEHGTTESVIPTGYVPPGNAGHGTLMTVQLAQAARLVAKNQEDRLLSQAQKRDQQNRLTGGGSPHGHLLDSFPSTPIPKAGTLLQSLLARRTRKDDDTQIDDQNHRPQQARISSSREISDPLPAISHMPALQIVAHPPSYPFPPPQTPVHPPIANPPWPEHPLRHHSPIRPSLIPTADAIPIYSEDSYESPDRPYTRDGRQWMLPYLQAGSLESLDDFYQPVAGTERVLDRPTGRLGLTIDPPADKSYAAWHGPHRAENSSHVSSYAHKPRTPHTAIITGSRVITTPKVAPPVFFSALPVHIPPPPRTAPIPFLPPAVPAHPARLQPRIEHTPSANSLIDVTDDSHLAVALPSLPLRVPSRCTTRKSTRGGKTGRYTRLPQLLQSPTHHRHDTQHDANVEKKLHPPRNMRGYAPLDVESGSAMSRPAREGASPSIQKSSLPFRRRLSKALRTTVIAARSNEFDTAT